MIPRASSKIKHLFKTGAHSGDFLAPVRDRSLRRYIGRLPGFLERSSILIEIR